MKAFSYTTVKCEQQLKVKFGFPVLKNSSVKDRVNTFHTQCLKSATHTVSCLPQGIITKTGVRPGNIQSIF